MNSLELLAQDDVNDVVDIGNSDLVVMVDVSVEWTVVVSQVLLDDLGKFVPVVGGLVAGSCTDGNVEFGFAIDGEAVSYFITLTALVVPSV